jgi:hypothetical protein
MPRGPARPWRELKPHTRAAFPFINAAIAQGYDVELTITELTADEWEDYKRGLFQAAKHSGVSVHVRHKKQADGSYHLTYAVHDKDKARAYVVQKYGDDRSKWPYNPRRPSPRDENGMRTDI